MRYENYLALCYNGNDTVKLTFRGREEDVKRNFNNGVSTRYYEWALLIKEENGQTISYFTKKEKS